MIIANAFLEFSTEFDIPARRPAVDDGFPLARTGPGSRG